MNVVAAGAQVDAALQVAALPRRKVLVTLCRDEDWESFPVRLPRRRIFHDPRCFLRHVFA